MFNVWMARKWRAFFVASGSRSYNQGSTEVGRAEFAEFLDAASRRVGQAIHPQVVFGLIDLTKQAAFQFLVLHQIELAFENGLLHTLADAFADFCYAAEPFAAGGSLC